MDARSSDALGIADILVEFAESVIDGPAQDKKENAAKPDDEGWVEWRSGECPVDPDTLVDVRLRIQLDGKRAGDLFWPTIAAYRVR